MATFSRRRFAPLIFLLKGTFKMFKTNSDYLFSKYKNTLEIFHNIKNHPRSDQGQQKVEARELFNVFCSDPLLKK